METNEIKVSVIVPAYNAEKTISKCINSILRQTLNELELIIVDDGSTDRTGDICTAYHDSRLRYIKKKNGGASTARNAGISLAKGKYIGFVDADDYIAPDMYERMYEACIQNDVPLCICDYKIEFANGKEAYYTDTLRGGYFNRTHVCDEALPLFLGAVCEDGRLRNTDWAVLRRLFRRSFLTEHQLLFDELLITSEDCLFSYLATHFADSMVYLKNAYLYINQRNANSLTRRYLPDYWQQRCQLMDQLQAVIDKTQNAWETNTFPVFVMLCVKPSFTNIAYGFGKNSIFHSLREFRTIVLDPRVRKMCEILDPVGFNEEWSKLFHWCRKKRYITLYLYHMDVVHHSKLCHSIRKVQKKLERTFGNGFQ